MTEDDAAYYRRRAEAEAEQSSHAATPAIARVHDVLTQAYRDRVIVVEAGERDLDV